MKIKAKKSKKVNVDSFFIFCSGSVAPLPLPDMERSFITKNKTKNKNKNKGKGGWRDPKTAPKDGTLFLADIGWAWATVCCWDETNREWTSAKINFDPAGKKSGCQFVTEFSGKKELVGWMQLPQIPVLY